MDRYSEVERKFDADPGALLPDLSGAAAAVSEAVESQLDATYFDTADTRLARYRITLRRRTGGDDAGWHLRLPAGIGASGPPAKRDAVPGQPRVGSVEVRGVQLRLHRLAHRGRGTGQVRQERAGVSIELTLNLAVTIHEL